MRDRYIRAAIMMCLSMMLGITLLVTGCQVVSIELAISGILVMLAGAVTSYLHLTYKDDDNKYW